MFWSWAEEVLNHALLTGKLHTALGWQQFFPPEFIKPGEHGESNRQGPNPRSILNFPMQGNGSEMLRIACCLGTEAGVEIVAPIHDAVMIHAHVDEIDAAVEMMLDAMAQASKVILNGFELGVDAKIIRYPDRYMDEKRGRETWDMIIGLLEEAESVRAEQSPKDEVVPFPRCTKARILTHEMAHTDARNRAFDARNRTTGPYPLYYPLFGYPFSKNIQSQTEELSEVVMAFDPDEFVLPDEPIGECIEVETQALRQARRQRRRNTEWFAKGPFPLSWIVACRRADPNGLDLAVGVLMKSGRSITEPDHKWVPITGNLGDQLGLSRGQRQRAVKALAIAGLAEIQLVSKHAPKLRLMQWELKERSAA